MRRYIDRPDRAGLSAGRPSHSELFEIRVIERVPDRNEERFSNLRKWLRCYFVETHWGKGFAGKPVLRFFAAPAVDDAPFSVADRAACQQKDFINSGPDRSAKTSVV